MIPYTYASGKITISAADFVELLMKRREYWIYLSRQNIINKQRFEQSIINLEQQIAEVKAKMEEK